MRALPVCLALLVVCPHRFYGNPPSVSSEGGKVSGANVKNEVSLPDAIGFLGVSTLPVPPALRAHLQIPADCGLLVDSVIKGAPAQTAGIQRHDLILKFDGQKIVTQAQFSALVAAARPGQGISILIIRAGRENECRATIGTCPLAPVPADPELLRTRRGEIDAALTENPAALEAVHRFLFRQQ